MRSPADVGGLGPVRAVLVAGATGFGVMAAELTAVRLLAPHFGDSAYVWTNVIGVILAAMALGAAAGGRLSVKANAGSWPFRLLLAAGLLLLLSPFVVRALGSALLPADLPLDAAMPALIRGSLVATAVVFAPPLLLLAAVTPLLVVLLARGGVSLGRAAGDVGSAGTVGSLIGTFAATHWLVPTFGCRIALGIAAGVLLLAALGIAPRRRRALAGTAIVGGLLVMLLHGGPLRPAPPGQVLLAERETRYQFLQVLASTATPMRTTLVINEALDSFHSLSIAGTCFTGGAYYDWHAIAPFLAGDGERPVGLRALSVGDAAGTLRQVYAGVHPGTQVDAVDIDGETMALGDTFFTAAKADGRRYVLDGRLFLDLSRDRWHVIHVDAYAHQVYVPAHLASREFFVAARERLIDGGVLACNVGSLDLDDPVLRAITATASDVFAHTAVFLIKHSRNALLVARRGRPLLPASLSRAHQATTALVGADRQHWQEIVERCADPTQWHEPTGDAPVLVDDRPLLDELLFDSYVDDDDPRQAVVCSGTAEIVAAELAAAEAARRERWSEVLAAVASSRTASAYLRQLAGDARWRMRQLHAAVAEYREGLNSAQRAEPVDHAMLQALQRRLDGAHAELQPIAAAEAAGSRNGWLSLLVMLVGAGLIAGVRRL